MKLVLVGWFYQTASSVSLATDTTLTRPTRGYHTTALIICTLSAHLELHRDIFLLNLQGKKKRGNNAIQCCSYSKGFTQTLLKHQQMKVLYSITLNVHISLLLHKVTDSQQINFPPEELILLLLTCTFVPIFLLFHKFFIKISPNITVQNSTNFYFIYYSFCTLNCMQTALNFKLMTPSTHINIEDL